MQRERMTNGDIVIWGTRELGRLAYFYYKDRAKVIGYIDNDREKWGKALNGVEIYPPNILREKKATVVLALRNGLTEIQTQLYEEFGIEAYIVFQMNEMFCTHEEERCSSEEVPEDTCIVAFSGGLGNQMFQYAFLKNLELQKKNVLADLEAYHGIGVMPFRLTEVFGNIKLAVCTQNQKKALFEKNMVRGKKRKKFIIYKEITSYESKREKKADMSLLDMTGGFIAGMHQSYKFAELIKEELLHSFTFTLPKEEKLKICMERMAKENAVSVHIRRGDYLSESNQWFYGNICTSEYYTNAIRYMREKVENCKFYIFSDDIEWMKKQSEIENATCIESTMFDDYQDWYDMYLMSMCKHNIIANSTFSWWGAWLNQNDRKIVIAPKKWVNICDYRDIYPESWVQM